MEKKHNLKHALLLSLEPKLIEDGFILKTIKEVFVRRINDITDVFQLLFLDAPDGYRVTLNVGIRFELVEEVFHRTSGFASRFQKDTTTIGGPLHGELAEGARHVEFQLTSFSDIESLAAELTAFFRASALPYYKTWASLDAVNIELNEDPKRPSELREETFGRCCAGIIIARLLRRPDYEALAAAYKTIVAQYSKGFYSQRFQMLLTELEHQTDGSSRPV